MTQHPKSLRQMCRRPREVCHGSAYNTHNPTNFHVAMNEISVLEFQSSRTPSVASGPTAIQASCPLCDFTTNSLNRS